MPRRLRDHIKCWAKQALDWVLQLMKAGLQPIASNTKKDTSPRNLWELWKKFYPNGLIIKKMESGTQKLRMTAERQSINNLVFSLSNVFKMAHLGIVSIPSERSLVLQNRIQTRIFFSSSVRKHETIPTITGGGKSLASSSCPIWDKRKSYKRFGGESPHYLCLNRDDIIPLEPTPFGVETDLKFVLQKIGSHKVGNQKRKVSSTAKSANNPFRVYIGPQSRKKKKEKYKL